MKKTDDIIKKDTKSEIIADTIEGEAKEYRLAFDTAARYLKSPKTEYEVKQKLYDKGFHKAEVDQVIEKMKYYKYIDDYDYCRLYISIKTKKMGRKKMEYKLINEKRVNEVVVKKAMAEFFKADDEKEKCKDFAIKYLNKKHLKLDREGWAKAGQHLYQKGYDWDTISSVLSSIKPDDLDSND